MFAVLEIEEHKNGLINKIQRFFASDDIVINYHTIIGAVPFITIKVTAGRSGINWYDVRNAAGVCAKRLLLPKDVNVPKGYGIFRFKPSLYRSIPVFNSMIKAIKTVDCAGKELNLTVLDRDGALSARIDKLMEKARHITVLTDNVSDYMAASQRIMNSFGAAIVLYDYDHPKIDDSIVFADKMDTRVSRCPIVFCADESSENTNIISGFELEAENDVLDKKPARLEMFDFVAALYELNNLKRAEEYSCKALKSGGEEITQEEVSRRIEKAL